MKKRELLGRYLTKPHEHGGHLGCLMEQLGGSVEFSGEYSAWEYRADSPLRRVSALYGVNQSLEGGLGDVPLNGDQDRAFRPGGHAGVNVGKEVK